MKKRVVSALMAVILLAGTVVLPTDGYHASTEKAQLETVLTSYFEERETEFMDGGAAGVQTYVTPIEMGRNQALEEWKEGLDIELVNVDISYEVGDTLQENDLEIQFMLYEWVSVEYKCNGYDVVETMGFGTDHIMTLSKESGNLEIVGDAYSEITGYEIGTEEELELLKLEEESVEADMVSLSDEMVQPYAAVTQPSYNAYAAVNYSNTWCGVSSAGTSSGTMTPSKYNPAYYYYDNDCCNFVSQCLYAGGLSMNSTWKTTTNTSGSPVQDTNISKSTTTWIRVAELAPYLNTKGFITKRITSASQGVAGNLLYWLAADGYSSNHIMMIAGKNASGQIIVNGHNSDMYKYPINNLSTKTYYTVCMAHNYSVSSVSSTNHKWTCSICNYFKTEAHTFINGSCTMCGYTK